MGIRQLCNKLFYPHTYSSAAYVAYLKECGVSIGEGTWFVKPKNTSVDVQNADFIEIGENVCITDGVTILAHDWSYSVIARAFNDAPGQQKITHIGNNVFIGTHAIILMGADIGDNVIIGAGSVVTGKVEDNSVYAGNPAKKICSLTTHYKKLKDKFEESAYCYLNREKVKWGVSGIRRDGVIRIAFCGKDRRQHEKVFFSFCDSICNTEYA